MGRDLDLTSIIIVIILLLIIIIIVIVIIIIIYTGEPFFQVNTFYRLEQSYISD